MINYIRNKKGFTLVEIIVVLVIIAILVATTLPALTGYIDNAREKTALSEGRTILVAAQTIASQMKDSSSNTEEIIEAQIEQVASSKNTKYPHINGLTGMKLKDTIEVNGVDVDTKGTVTKFNYISSNGKAVTYTLANGIAMGTS